MAFLKTAAIILVIFYVAICLLLFFGQRKFMYFPDNSPVADIQRDPVWQLVTTTSDDGLELQHLYRPAAAGRPTMLLFHGNGGNISLRLDKFDFLTDQGVGVFLTEYRGYGGNPGSPTEDGLYADARSAVSWLADQGVTHDKLVIFGASMGSGVATQTASELAEADTPVAGLILEAPFTSMAATAQFHYSWLPAYWLTRDRYESIDRITNIKTPLLIIHGQQDRTVPHALGRELFEAAAEPKTHISLPDAGHSYLLRDATARDAVEALVLGPKL